MTRETVIQKKVLMDSIILKPESLGGLGYSEGRRNEVSTDGTMIHMPSFKKFHENQNKHSIKGVCKAQDWNADTFWKEFTKFIHDEIYLRSNAAIQIYYNKKTPYRVKFKGYEFCLYKPFKRGVKNEWVAIEEYEYKFKDCDYARRPDITFWLNGIFFSLLELKHLIQGQCAEDGVDKIVHDFTESVSTAKNAYNSRTRIDEDVALETFTKIYSSSIITMATDGKDTYVSRNLRKFETEVYRIKKNNLDDYDVKQKIKKSFEKIESFNETNINNNLEKTLHFFYSKKNIQNELAIFNFGFYSRNAKGNVTDNTKFMATPRHKQVFGARKVIDDLTLRLQNENNPNYVIEKEIARLKKQEYLTEDEFENAIKLRKQYSNDLTTDSYLLQYSAGFGKTYTMIYLMQHLNRIFKMTSAFYDNNNEDLLYGKIIAVMDRNDLNDQFYKNMLNSNIDKSSIVEISSLENKADQSRLEAALIDSKKTFIIITVQSFGKTSITKLSEKSRKILAKTRYALLIDEVHRTQNGQLNDQMMSLFTDLANERDTQERNLIIGFTATPKEETLQRYGHFVKIGPNGAQWKPFDSYTLKEAIADGFVLNPIQNMISITTTISINGTVDKDGKLPSGADIHVNEDYISETSKQFARILKEHTFTKINKQGKGMLVAASIKAAIRFRVNLIKNGINENKVYIVFSDNEQAIDDLKTLNPHVKTTKKAAKKNIVSTFIADKQAVIIVVDMLQTGFDEPLLHTLLIAKPVRDIPAVQLGCRINRPHVNKNDCLIVDATYKNVNIKSFEYAFEKYEGIVVAQMNQETYIKELKKNKPLILSNEIYKKFFNEVMICIDPDGIINDFDLMNKILAEKTKVEKYIKDVSSYLSIYEKLSGVIIGVSKTYFIKNLDAFKNRLSHILKTVNKKQTILFEIESSEIEPDSLFELLNSEIDEGSRGNKKKEKSKTKKQLDDILKRIKAENEMNQSIEDLIFEFNIVKGEIFSEIVSSKYSGKSPLKWKNPDLLEQSRNEFRQGFIKFLRRKNKLSHKDFWIDGHKNEYIDHFDEFLEYLEDV